MSLTTIVNSGISRNKVFNNLRSKCVIKTKKLNSLIEIYLDEPNKAEKIKKCLFNVEVLIDLINESINRNKALSDSLKDALLSQEDLLKMKKVSNLEHQEFISIDKEYLKVNKEYNRIIFHIRNN